jgi:fumarate reductase flavoprotein subunit
MKHEAVIAGAGAAGLMTALRAASLGARVALLDIAAGERSNIVVSGGMFAGAGTRFQADAGIDDNPGIFADDIRRKTDGAVDPVILHAVTTRAADAVHFIADDLGLAIRLAVGVDFPGHSVPRLHATDAQDGGQLARMLMAVARDTEKIRLFENTEVMSLHTEGGRVAGVATARGERTEAPVTVLACGGFAGNAEMVARFAPEIVGAVNIGNGPNDGRALDWGAALGGELLFMDSYQGQGHVTVDGKGRLGPGLTSLGAIVVNSNGLRFGDESMGPSEWGAHVLAQPGGTAVEIFDETMHAAMSAIGSYRDSVARGCVKSAAMIDDLAALFALPPNALAATVAAYNDAARNDTPDPLGRETARKPLVPPYRAARVTGALAHTQGGLRVDSRARALRRDGTVIPGLLAAGGAAACVSGHGAAGYMPGNGIGHAFALGLIAGETIATSQYLTGARTS